MDLLNRWKNLMCVRMRGWGLPEHVGMYCISCRYDMCKLENGSFTVL